MRPKAAAAWLPAVVALLMLAACGQPRYAPAQLTMGPEGWLAADTLCLRADSLPAEGRYELRLGLRTSAQRPYLYRQLVVEVRTGLGPRQRVDTLTLPLATADGQVLGSGVARYQYEFPLDTLQLPLCPALTVRVVHLMRHDPLPGVADVSAALVPLQPSRDGGAN